MGLFLTIQNVNSQVIIKVKPVKPKVVVVKPAKPGPNHIWKDEHWQWNPKKKEYVWIEGHWIKRKKGKNWIPGHWKKVPAGCKWIPGHWA